MVVFLAKDGGVEWKWTEKNPVSLDQVCIPSWGEFLGKSARKLNREILDIREQ